MRSSQLSQLRRSPLSRAAAVGAIVLTGPAGVLVAQIAVRLRRLRSPRTEPLSFASTLSGVVCVSAAALGTLGAVAGLIIGLFANVWTAPFAAVEIGLPSTIVGAVAGLVFGSTYLGIRLLTRRRRL